MTKFLQLDLPTLSHPDAQKSHDIRLVRTATWASSSLPRLKTRSTRQSTNSWRAVDIGKRHGRYSCGSRADCGVTKVRNHWNVGISDPVPALRTLYAHRTVVSPRKGTRVTFIDTSYRVLAARSFWAQGCAATSCLGLGKQIQ